MTPAVAWLEAEDSPAWERSPWAPVGLASIKPDHHDACKVCRDSGEVIVIEPDDWQPSAVVVWLESGYDEEMRLGEVDIGDGRLVAAAAPRWRPHVRPMFQLKDGSWARPMSWFPLDD